MAFQVARVAASETPTKTVAIRRYDRLEVRAKTRNSTGRVKSPMRNRFFLPFLSDSIPRGKAAATRERPKTPSSSPTELELKPASGR